MKTLKVVFGILAILLLIFLIGALFMPAKLTVSESQLMKAESEIIFDQVNCFRNWENWNPWKDSLMVEDFTGPECGVGAVYTWNQKDMGGGKQTIIEVTENEMIKTEVIFDSVDPVFSFWYFKKTDEGTKVTWTFEMPLGYPFWRWLGNLFMKPAIRTSYASGLAALNDFTKDMEPETGWKMGDITEKEVKAQHAVAIKATVMMEEMNRKMSELFQKIGATTGKYKMETAGSPMSIWHTWNPDGESVMECAIPVKKPGKLLGEVKMIKTYEGKVVSAIHYGPYETSGQTWEALDKKINEMGYAVNGSPWEVYLKGHESTTDPAEYVTEIYYPVK